jgi:hypothetical protein
MSKIITLSRLSYEDLKRCNAWKTTGDIDSEDCQLGEVVFDKDGNIPASIGEVWCLCSTIFADHSIHQATSLCRGDGADGPLLWSVWNGEVDVPILLPPAPPEVLQVQGPEVIATSFNRSISDIFPLTIVVVPQFAVAPHIRSIRLGVEGIIQQNRFQCI